MIEFLRDNPDLDVNWKDKAGGHAVFTACSAGHEAVVAILLAHPKVDVNQKNNYGVTPFFFSCEESIPCASLLLKDSRVRVDEPSFGEDTPLRYLACYGQVDVLEKWIASGREIYATSQEQMIEEARSSRLFSGVTTKKIQGNPAEILHAIRVSTGWYDEQAAELFAQVVFVSDGLLQVVSGRPVAGHAARFIDIARRLPLELQMMLCCSAAGSAKSVIGGNDSEEAFKNLARRCLLQQLFG